MNFDNKNKYVRLGFSSLILLLISYFYDFFFIIISAFLCFPNQNVYEEKLIKISCEVECLVVGKMFEIKTR